MSNVCGVGSGDPTVGLLPPASDGYAAWSTAGLNAIPLTGFDLGDDVDRHWHAVLGVGPGQTICGPGIASGTQISPKGTDDTSALNTALNDCPPGEVVLLTTGVFRISSGGIQFQTNSCTLRGSGPSAHRNRGA